jgi:predicted HTH domain antitoxin
MEVVVSIPDIFIPPSVADETVSRDLLEAYAIENYRQEKMSLGRIAELLGFSIDETHAFLKAHKIPLNYDLEDMARDRRTIEMFLNR